MIDWKKSLQLSGSVTETESERDSSASLLLLCQHTSAPRRRPSGPGSSEQIAAMVGTITELWEWMKKRPPGECFSPSSSSFLCLCWLSLSGCCGAKLVAMARCCCCSCSCCRLVLLTVEVAVLVTLLAAGGAAQTDSRREAGSSCYGGFDLYFVLDKWVKLLWCWSSEGLQRGRSFCRAKNSRYWRLWCLVCALTYKSGALVFVQRVKPEKFHRRIWDRISFWARGVWIPSFLKSTVKKGLFVLWDINEWFESNYDISSTF